MAHLSGNADSQNRMFERQQMAAVAPLVRAPMAIAHTRTQSDPQRAHQQQQQQLAVFPPRPHSSPPQNQGQPTPQMVSQQTPQEMGIAPSAVAASIAVTQQQQLQRPSVTMNREQDANMNNNKHNNNNNKNRIVEEEQQPQSPEDAGVDPGEENGGAPGERPALEVGCIIRERWAIVRQIGGGAFGETYEAEYLTAEQRSVLQAHATDPETSSLVNNVSQLSQPARRSTRPNVCIKVEKSDKRQALRTEIVALKRAQECDVVVRYIASGHDAAYTINFLVMECLGDNLAEVRRKYDRGMFDLFSALQFGLSCLAAIEGVHRCGIVHRDIKPSNFTVAKVISAMCADPFRCFIIDFGLARKYRGNDGHVREPRSNAGFRGTARYASINSHLHRELYCVDDLWSLFFMIVEWIAGRLPWRGMKDKDEILQEKQRYLGPLLVRYLPREFGQFQEHLMALDAMPPESAVPDYNLLRDLLRKCIVRKSCVLKLPLPFASDEYNDWAMEQRNRVMGASPGSVSGNGAGHQSASPSPAYNHNSNSNNHNNNEQRQQSINNNNNNNNRPLIVTPPEDVIRTVGGAVAENQHAAAISVPAAAPAPTSAAVHNPLVDPAAILLAEQVEAKARRERQPQQLELVKTTILAAEAKKRQEEAATAPPAASSAASHEPSDAKHKSPLATPVLVVEPAAAAAAGSGTLSPQVKQQQPLPQQQQQYARQQNILQTQVHMGGNGSNFAHVSTSSDQHPLFDMKNQEAASSANVSGSYSGALGLISASSIVVHPGSGQVGGDAAAACGAGAGEGSNRDAGTPAAMAEDSRNSALFAPHAANEQQQPNHGPALDLTSRSSSQEDVANKKVVMPSTPLGVNVVVVQSSPKAEVMSDPGSLPAEEGGAVPSDEPEDSKTPTVPHARPIPKEERSTCDCACIVQ